MGGLSEVLIIRRRDALAANNRMLGVKVGDMPGHDAVGQDAVDGAQDRHGGPNVGDHALRLGHGLLAAGEAGQGRGGVGEDVGIDGPDGRQLHTPGGFDADHHMAAVPAGLHEVVLIGIIRRIDAVVAGVDVDHMRKAVEDPVEDLAGGVVVDAADEEVQRMVRADVIGEGGLERAVHERIESVVGGQVVGHRPNRQSVNGADDENIDVFLEVCVDNRQGLDGFEHRGGLRSRLFTSFRFVRIFE